MSTVSKISGLFLLQSGILAALVGLGCLPAAAQAKQAQPAQPAQPARPQQTMPSNELLIALIRSSLSALDQADSTNNYTVMNALGSDSFIANFSPARLSQMFEPLRRNGINLVGTLVIQPQLDSPAKLDQGRLQLVGHFETRPRIIQYNLIFEPSRGAWRMAGINVNLVAAK